MDLTAKRKWISIMQLGGTIAGAIIVVVLRLKGIRFLGYVPTFVFVWPPMIIGSGATLALKEGPRTRWIPWGIGLLIFVGATVYLGVGETPSALLPPPTR